MFVKHGMMDTHQKSGYINLNQATEIYTGDIDFFPENEGENVKRINAEKKYSIFVVLNGDKSYPYLLETIYDTLEAANDAAEWLIKKAGVIEL